MPHPLFTRAAVVATGTTAAALAALLPTTPPAPGAVPAPSPVPVLAASALRPVPAALSAPAAVGGRLAPAAAAAPARGVRAMSAAMGKIGSPYRWGAAGPRAFDCSGLVYWAYKQQGMTLPRSSRAMSGVGTPVSKANLRPGDLVFFYRPVSHVAIYIGKGMVVHASTAGKPVKTARLDSMPFSGARRL